MKLYKLPPSALLLVAALAAASACLSAQEIPRRQRVAEKHLRVVTANIRFTDKETPGEEWEKRRQLARDVLLAQDADIICFQEFRQAHLDFLQTCLPDFEATGMVDGPANRKANTIFFSKKRFQKTGAGGCWLSPEPDKYRSKFPESGSVRHVAFVKLRDLAADRELIVYNTHLDHAKQPGRDRQAGVLAEFITKAPAALPKILTGDFNCPATTGAIKTIKAAGMIDTYTAVHGEKDPGFTYHGFKGATLNKPWGKIDFVFCNHALKPVTAEIIRDSRAGHWPSDHYFVTAELEYDE